MKLVYLVLPLALFAAGCSDEDMAKWKEMNKDRVESTPNEEPNLPEAKGDVEAVKKGVKEFGDRAKKAASVMMGEDEKQ